MKLLYYLDFWHFKETGRSVTNQTYRAWEMGPVPQQIFYEISPENSSKDLSEFLFVEENITDEVTGKHQFDFKPKKEFNEKIFTKREIAILKKVADVFLEATGEQMKDSTHLLNAPWDKTMKGKGNNAIIDYKVALDSEKNSLTEGVVDEKIRFDKENRELLSSI